MALSWNTMRGFPRLTNYKDAADWEANVKPIRGDEAKRKPLGRRDQKWRHIKREENGHVTAYEGDRPLIRWRPDDTVLVYDANYWGKATQHDVILGVLGLGCETFDTKVWARTRDGRFALRPSPKAQYDRIQNKWVQPTEQPLPENVFKREGSSWVYLNPPANVVPGIKRKAMNEVRKQYGDFIKYASAIYKLRRDNPPKVEEYVEPFDLQPSFTDSAGNPVHRMYSNSDPQHPYSSNFTHDHAEELRGLMLSADLTDQYKAYLWLARARWGERPEITKVIDRVLIMHHHDEVLTTREVSAGKKGKDNYKWAIPRQK